MKKLLSHDALIGLAVAALAFSFYAATVSPTVTAEDCGELAAAVSGLGIVHPTGYPVFTMLAWAFLHLPLGGRAIWKLNLFGGVLCFIATLVFFRVFLLLLSARAASLFRARTASEGKAKTRSVDRAAAAIAALILAFSKTYWSEAVSLEVYALHLVFLSLVTLLFLRSLSAWTFGPSRRPNPLWTVFVFVLGLSFANHMMTVLLAPAFLLLYFQTLGWTGNAWKRIATAVPAFLLGLSPYLYLPLRSAQSPLMNWGEPSTPRNLWRHVTAAQYHAQMFSSASIAETKFLYFFKNLPGEFGYVPLLVALAGAWILGRQSPRLLVFCLLLFFVCLFYAVNYAFDDPNFYLNAYFAIAVCIAFGVRALLGFSGGLRRPGRLLAGALVLFPLGLNYRFEDKSRDYSVEDYTRNVLNSVDSGAVLFSNEYERLASPAFYLQQVEGLRPDVAILDITLLGNPWFYRHLEARYPVLTQGSRREIDAFLPDIEGAMEGKSDSAAFNAAVLNLFTSLVEKNIDLRPVYVSTGINPAMLRNYLRIPSGMVLRLERPTRPLIVPRPLAFPFRPLPPPEINPLSLKIRQEYAEGYGNQGSFRIAVGDTAGGIALFRKALETQSDFPQVAALLAELERTRRAN